MTGSLDWDRLASRYDADLVLFKTRFDQMRHPVSEQVLERLVLESVDWVNCVAIDRDGRHVMIRQYRFGVSATTLETPGGMVDAGEGHGDAARRELLEETGYGGGTWHYLGAVEPNPAIHNHLCHHWLARGVELQAEQDPGEGEHIAVELMDGLHVVEAARSGEIKHALALSVISRVLDLWGPLPFDSVS